MTVENGKPWDVKSLTLSLGGADDENGFITFEVFDDNVFNIYEGSKLGEEHEWFYEEIDIDAARRLRDFLNFAVPNK